MLFVMFVLLFFFFCKQKTAYEMRISDWSSDVCSSDLGAVTGDGYAAISVAGTIEFPGADSVVVQYRLEGATDWTMAGEFPAISPLQQVIAPLASLGSYDVEIAYRSDGIIGDDAVFSGVAAGAGKLATIEEGARRLVLIDRDRRVLMPGPGLLRRLVAQRVAQDRREFDALHLQDALGRLAPRRGHAAVQDKPQARHRTRLVDADVIHRRLPVSLCFDAQSSRPRRRGKRFLRPVRAPEAARGRAGWRSRPVRGRRCDRAASPADRGPE